MIIQRISCQSLFSNIKFHIDQLCESFRTIGHFVSLVLFRQISNFGPTPLYHYQSRQIVCRDYDMNDMFRKYSFLLIFFALSGVLTYGQSTQIEEDKSHPAVIMRDKVYQALNEKKFDLAFLRIDSMESISREMNDSLYIGVALNVRAELSRIFRKYTDATPNYMQALLYFGASDAHKKYIQTLEGLSSNHMSLGNIDSALHYSVRVKNSYKKFDLPLEKGKFYQNLAGIYAGSGPIDSCIHYYLLALNEPIHDYLKGTIYHNLSLKFSDIYNFNKAELYVDSAIDSQIKTSSKYIGDSYVLKGQYKLYNNLYSEAEALVKQAIALFEETNMPSSLSYAKVILGDIFYGQGKYEEAFRIRNELELSDFPEDSGQRMSFVKSKIQDLLYADKLEEIPPLLNIGIEKGKKANNLYMLSSLYKTASAYYERVKDPQNQALMLDKYSRLRDSLYGIQQMHIAERLETQYQVKNKEQQIAKLKLEDDLKATQLKFQRWMLFGGLGVLILLLSLLFIIFGRNKKISTQNEIIQKALKEKNVLLKEIHHRVKNNLQVVSSLLGLQSRNIKDSKALAAIKEGRARVQSMSLIHQNLYKKDNFTGIKVQTYLDKLCQNLFQTYDISPNKVELHTSIDEMTLDVETVVPLGLIINELISNALKYAFPDDRNGIINISLNETNEGLQLIVQDDGVGMENPEQAMSGDSFGYDLIDAFKTKLNADLSIESLVGTKVIMLIRNYKKTM